MKCKLCASDQGKIGEAGIVDFEYGAPGKYDYWQCDQCGLLNIDPVPDGSILDAAYPLTYHAYHPHHSPLSRWLKQRFWKKKARRYSKYATGKGAILELGCAFGDLLTAFQDLGFSNVRGLDSNQNAVDHAQAARLQVDQGMIEDFNFKGQTFQLVVMENFIEHVYDPVDTLVRCNRLLDDGGFVAGETPNVDAWDRTLFGKYWGGYHTPRHLYLFNCENLGLLAKKAGFRVRRISNLLQPAHWAISVQNYLQDSRFPVELKNGRSFYFSWGLLLAVPINILQKMISKTSSVEFVFEKVESL